MFRLSNLFFIACEQALRGALEAGRPSAPGELARRLVLKYFDTSSLIQAFLKPHFFCLDSCVRGVKHSGEQFQKDAVSVSGLKYAVFKKDPD